MKNQPAPTQAGDVAAPMWRQIADALARAIGEGRYAVGAPLPTALALAEQHGVHRHTVRQAFRNLQERGLVSVEQGRGTFVTQPHFPYKLGKRVRFRSNAGAAGFSVAGDLLGAEIGPAAPSVAEALKLPAGTPVWCFKTLSRADGVPISMGVHYAEAARFPDFADQLRAAGNSVTKALAAMGIPDYIRLSTGLSARTASEEEAKRLELAPGAAVIVSRALDGTPDGRPLQMLVSAFAGERVEFIVEPETTL